MRETFGAKNERSWWMRTHAQTAGCALTAQQPENNVVRVALQALAAVLGGANSLHTNGMDEAWALPSEKAALLALRTQQLIAHESGVASTVDPLGGSYFVETLTNQVEEGAREYFRRIDDLGGALPCIDNGFFVREIADASYRFQREVEDQGRIIVGVNDFVTEQEDMDIPILQMDKEGERKQIARLNEVRRTRDNREVSRTLADLRQAARADKNLMPFILSAVKAYATLGETMDVLRDVFGVYEPAGGA